MRSKQILITAVFTSLVAVMCILIPQNAFAYTMSNDHFEIETGSLGQISSLRLTGDTFPTNYVMNAENAPQQDTPDQQWLGNLMFTYKLGDGDWTKAWTNKSADGRTVSHNGDTVTVTYENASDPEGIKNFKVVETYSLIDDYLRWEIKVTNTSNQPLEIGDFGLPLPFNEYWTGRDNVFENSTITSSYIGNDSSYIHVRRPSGIGPSLLMVPDSKTGAGFEYQERWTAEEHPNTTWAMEQGGWTKGLNVYYVHSNYIKRTNSGYLPNTSLFLKPDESKTYAFKFLAVEGENDLKDTLYNEGLIDVTAVPGMMFATNMTAKFDLRTSETINSVTAEYPNETTINHLKTDGDHHVYELTLNRLGPNDITIEYGNGKKTVLQFYAIEPIADALQRHSTFMVEKTQWDAPGEIYDKVFDDWMMQTKSKRGEFSGYWGWGDDWGYTHGQFLAEKNVLKPVASEITAVDEYLETTIWDTLMAEHHDDYLIHDFLMPDPNTTPTYRGYAYPHIYNTYFSMYKIAKLYPNLVDYKHHKNTYLLRAYNIFKALYDGPVAYNWNTGLMGESTTPEIIKALQEEGFTSEANDMIAKMDTKYNNLAFQAYPYGSEYNYDNTGEEAVYMLAKMNNNKEVMRKINTKTRASRGHQPAWYYYTSPVTITGENWWNFQYTASLAGYAMDDWIRNYSTTPEIEQRLSYAAKIANIGAINSGQIDSDPENIGAVSWTYQAEKGDFAHGVGGGQLFNGWRGMSGEADLGLWGAVRILSADVVNDPIFGLYCYGCDLKENGSNYEITPKDGVFQRLNLISKDFSMELERDQYTAATVAATKDYVNLSLKNVTPGIAHTTDIKFSGLSAGSYEILVNDEKAGFVKAVDGEETIVTINVGIEESYDVTVQKGSPEGDLALNATASASFTDPETDTSAAINGFTDKPFWGTQGSENAQDWYELDFGAPTTLDDVRLYFYTEPKQGGYSEPSIYSIQYFDGNEWVDVPGQYKTPANPRANYNHVQFPEITVEKVRVLITHRADHSTGLKEIQVFHTGVTPREATNQAPDVTAGEYDVNQSPLQTSLKGIAKDDGYPDGTLDAAWSVESGPGTVEFENANAFNTIATFSEPGTYKLRITVSDGELSSSSETTVAIDPPPEPEVIPPPKWPEAGGNIALYATPSASYTSPWEDVKAINDGIDPPRSNDTENKRHGTWPEVGTQWVQLEWDNAVTIDESDVYFFDDNGGVRVPASWKIQYWDGDSFEDVKNPSQYGTEIDQYNKVTFDPVKTTRLRLVMESGGASVGVLEWKAYTLSPELKAENISQTGLTLQWTSAVNMNKNSVYKIYQNGDLISEVSGDKHTYEVTGLDHNTEYEFTVEVGNGEEWTNNGPSLKVTTPDKFEAELSITSDVVQQVAGSETLTAQVQSENQQGALVDLPVQFTVHKINPDGSMSKEAILEEVVYTDKDGKAHYKADLKAGLYQVKTSLLDNNYFKENEVVNEVVVYNPESDQKLRANGHVNAGDAFGDNTNKIHMQSALGYDEDGGIDGRLRLKTTPKGMDLDVSIEWLAIGNDQAYVQGTAENGEGQIYTVRIMLEKESNRWGTNQAASVILWEGKNTEAEPAHELYDKSFKGSIQF